MDLKYQLRKELVEAKEKLTNAKGMKEIHRIMSCSLLFFSKISQKNT